MARGRAKSGNGDYRWDVFISYPRRPGIRRWVADVFHPQLEEDLHNVGVGTPRIFRDQQELEAGDIWPERLSAEHAASRVVLAVLCYPYFESAWCCSEWTTASARKGTAASIVPVRFNDLKNETLETLPATWRTDVKKRQCLDVEEYTTLVNRLSDTDLAHRFRVEMKHFCERVLKPAIVAAPPPDPKWPKMPTEPVLRQRPAFRARLRR
jgi:hypothetical protein